MYSCISLQVENSKLQTVSLHPLRAQNYFNRLRLLYLPAVMFLTMAIEKRKYHFFFFF